MKYLLYSLYPAPERTEGLLISGLYHWREAFGGVVAAPPPDELQDYDIVHLNFTADGLPLLGDLAEYLRGSSTKLVVNVDYGVDLWPSHILYPTLVLRELDKADLIFHVEPRGAYLLERALNRPVPVIPHPLDTDALLSVARSTRRELILTHIIHRYDHSFAEPWIMNRVLRRAFQEYPELGKAKYGALYCNAHPEQEYLGRYRAHFDRFATWTAYDKYLKRLAQSAVVFDPYNFNTFGRAVGECACLGIPAVTHRCVYAGVRLFPELTFGREDVDKKLNALQALFLDRDVYEKISRDAYERAVSLFSYSVSRRRILEALGLVDTFAVVTGKGEQDGSQNGAA